MQELELQKQQMIEQQLKRRGIADRQLLHAMSDVPREAFMPTDMVHLSYIDGPVPIGHGQTISQPYIVAYMLEILDLKPTDKLLEIGTGCGYNAAIASRLVKEVYSIELVEELANSARIRLHNLGFENIHVKCGDGFEGIPEHAPYDAIILTAAPKKVPQALFDQLAERGRLIAPEGILGGVQRLNLYHKRGEEIVKEELLQVSFVPMVHGP